MKAMLMMDFNIVPEHIQICTDLQYKYNQVR